jgi:putative membrane protein
MLDVLLAYLHHLAVFSLVGILFAEFVLIRPGLTGARLQQVAGIDRAYGTLAVLVVIAGVARVYLGSTGENYYLANHVFWTKMALFILVGILSIAPTRAILGWRKAAIADSAYAVSDDAVRGARRWIHIQFLFLALIPLAAAAMAQGVGL